MAESHNDPAAYKAAHRDLLAAEREAQIVQEERDPPAMTAGRLEKLLSELPADAEIVPFEVTPSIASGESAIDALARIREKITEKLEEQAAVLATSRTKGEMMEAARAQVRRLASSGVPLVRGLLQGGAIAWPRTKLGFTAGHFYQHAPDGVAFAAWLLEDALLQRLEKIVDANVSADAMTEDAQFTRDATIQLELLALQRQEAAIVEAIVKSGGGAVHSPFAAVEAVLAIAVDPIPEDDIQ
jgi:hypothetical protein